MIVRKNHHCKKKQRSKFVEKVSELVPGCEPFNLSPRLKNNQSESKIKKQSQSFNYSRGSTMGSYSSSTNNKN